MAEVGLAARRRVVVRALVVVLLLMGDNLCGDETRRALGALRRRMGRGAMGRAASGKGGDSALRCRVANRAPAYLSVGALEAVLGD